MAKVYAMSKIRLQLGVKPEDFEKFMKEELPRVTPYVGWKVYLLKGQRGDREGKYLWMYEIDSLETRDRYYPLPDGPTEEVEQFQKAHPEMMEWYKKYLTFATPPGIIITDYVVVSESG